MYARNHARWFIGLFLSISGCSSESPDGSKEIQFDFEASDPFWYGYTLVSESPIGAGFRVSTGKDCETSGRRPELSLGFNKYQAGTYQTVSDYELRAFFSKKDLSRLYLSGSLNPFSNNEELSARFTGGTIRVEPLKKSPTQEPGKLPNWESIRISISATIDPKHFRPHECSSKWPKDGTAVEMECSCKNAEAKLKTCRMNFDSSKVDESNPPDDQCCSQLNTHTPEPVTVHGTFTAKYCPNLCASINPSLLPKLCPNFPVPDTSPH